MTTPAPFDSQSNALDAPPAARPAATVVVVRDGQDGLEVLLLRRAERDENDRSSGAWVFPGGAVEAVDARTRECCRVATDAQASRALAAAEQGPWAWGADALDYYVCAVRECFEEAGLLYAYAAGGELVAASEAAAEAWSRRRTQLYRAELSLVDLCREQGLELALDRLVYLSHWVTPLGQAKRFDTRFFVAEAPPAQTSAHDELELVEHVWLKPADVGARKLLPPTRVTLELIGHFPNVAALMAWARSPREIPRIEPRMATGSRGLRPVLPSEAAWAEIGRRDPEGRGHASYEIKAAEPVRLSPRVLRVTADNAGFMTGPGTNTYLVGEGDSWAVIDPGPASSAHVDRIIAAAPGAIRFILVTHTHADHSPAALELKARTGASLYGRLPDHPQSHDPSFVPDVSLSGGERIALAHGANAASAVSLRVIHTPGHASNHLCYLLEEEQSLFTGDHVMQGSTVVIAPPDGDMAAYLGSLRALLDVPLAWLLPGHGFSIAEPHAVLQQIIAHRLKREAAVLSALQALAPASAERLLPQAYADVDPRLHPVALRSLLAHLRKLASDGVALEHAGAWSLL